MEPFTIHTAIQYLAAVDPVLQSEWKDYDAKWQLPYVDIAGLSGFIIEKAKNNETKIFKPFFDRVEEILHHCDDLTLNFMVVGLLESIHNRAGYARVNYWTGFDPWLSTKTKENWVYLIFLWEGEDAIEKYKQENPGKDALV